MKTIAIFAFIFLACLAKASEAAHGASHGLDAHQIKTIIYQTINVTIMFIGLIYFSRKPIAKMLHEKKQAYIVAAARADQIKKEAEKELYEMKIRVSKLEATAEESVMRARAEAVDMKAQLIEESRIVSARIKHEAEIAAKLEIEKAKQALREEMIAQAAQLARGEMAAGISANDQKKLKTEFIRQVGGAQA